MRSIVLLFALVGVNACGNKALCSMRLKAAIVRLMGSIFLQNNDGRWRLRRR